MCVFQIYVLHLKKFRNSYKLTRSEAKKPHIAYSEKSLRHLCFLYCLLRVGE